MEGVDFKECTKGGVCVGDGWEVEVRKSVAHQLRDSRKFLRNSVEIHPCRDSVQNTRDLNTAVGASFKTKYQTLNGELKHRIISMKYLTGVILVNNPKQSLLTAPGIVVCCW